MHPLMIQYVLVVTTTAAIVLTIFLHGSGGNVSPILTDQLSTDTRILSPSISSHSSNTLNAWHGISFLKYSSVLGTSVGPWKLRNSFNTLSKISTVASHYLEQLQYQIAGIPLHSPRRESLISKRSSRRGLAGDKPTAPAPAGHYHERLYHHNYSDHSVHRHSWMVLEEVDGLQNKDVVMLVTSTMVQEGLYLRERIIASARTWMRLFANVVVIIEDTFDTRWAMRHCVVMEYTHYTAFECHGEPIYLLSRTCSNAYYGADGPCCKLDDGLNFVSNVAQDLFPDVKFLLHSDDDVFWRADQTLRWLAAVHSSGISDVYPLVANAQKGDPENHGVWHIKGCEEIHTTGWYQPLMLNHLALKRLRTPVAHYAVKDTCKNFDVTHDVGFGVVAWMMQLLHIAMPNVEINGAHQGIPAMKPDQMAVHYLKHHKDDDCHTGGKWPAAIKYEQNIVIGCGDIDQPSPGHDGNKQWGDMYDAWKYFENNGKDVQLQAVGANEWVDVPCVVKSGVLKAVLQEGSSTENTAKLTLVDGSKYALSKGETIENRVVPRLVALSGYAGTRHGKQHHVTEKWNAFGLNDCEVKGKVG